MAKPRLLVCDWKDPRAYEELADLVDVETYLAEDLLKALAEKDDRRVHSFLLHSIIPSKTYINLLKQITPYQRPILIQEPKIHHEIWKKKFQDEGCDMRKVYFVESYSEVYDTIRKFSAESENEGHVPYGIHIR